MSQKRETTGKVVIGLLLVGALAAAVGVARLRVGGGGDASLPVAAGPDAESPKGRGAAALPVPVAAPVASDASLEDAGSATADASGEDVAIPDAAGDAGEAIAAGDGGCPARDYTVALRKAREHLAAGRRDEADRAFDEAVRARPYDARARAERAHARLFGGGDAGASSGVASAVWKELELARALATDRALLASIAYDEALAREAAGDVEAARVALVRAAGLGSAAAEKKLGAGSRCAVTAATSGADLPLEPTWSGVLAKVAAGSTCDPPAAAGEAEARAYACGSCSGAGGTFQKGTCAGAGPWTMNVGSMHCASFTALVQDVGAPDAGAFYVAAGPGAQTRLEREGKVWVLREAPRQFAWINGHFASGDPTYRKGEGWTDEPAPAAGRCLADESADAVLSPSTGCQASMGATLADEEHRTYFDDRGRWLAGVVIKAGSPAIKVTSTGLAVDGAGCRIDVPFAKR